jgi:glycosyltransferase involved in cell wall biosynthesis
MRGKVLEAFASGLPVVSTALGMEGIAATSGQHYLSADHEAEFATAIVRYLRDRRLARTHGAAARDLVEHTYDTHAVFSMLETAYEEAVAKRAASTPKVIA